MPLRRIAGLLLVGAMLSGCGYNRIQELDERTEELKSNIGVELTNRNSLIPNLVATVQGAAEFERGTFTDVARARAGLLQAQEGMQQAIDGGDVEQMAAAEGALNGQLRSFLTVSVEAYPQLRAQENFMALQDQLAESENKIGVARRDYNESVRIYNSYVRQFPQAVTARVIGADRKEPYEAPAGSEEVPQVDFGG
ncbi:MAG TPA: LemA family protein [Longimicrobiaceae bacterium]